MTHILAIERSVKYYAPSGVLFNRLWNSLENTTEGTPEGGYVYKAFIPTYLAQKETARALAFLAKDGTIALPISIQSNDFDPG